MKRILSVMLILGLLFTGCGKKEETAEETLAPIDDTITLVAFGDNLMHGHVIKSGLQEDGSYDYSPIFDALRSEIKNADIAIINQETVFGGEEMGYSGYPAFNSPSDMGRTLVKEGFDVVLHATNHSLDKGTKGIENTLAFWEEFPDVAVLGIHESPEDKEAVEIVEAKGARLAMLNYTYGTNGIKIPESKSYLLSYIDEEKIEKDALYAEENADFTIAFMHWGNEYWTTPSDAQRDLAEKMCEWGVDLIIGAHPHVLEPVEWVESENGNRTLVYYSLGNFVSRQKEALNLLGGMANITLKFDGEKVTLEHYSLTPLINHYDKTYRHFTVYPFRDYTDELAAEHGVTPHDGKVSRERFQEMLNTIFEDYDPTVLTD